MLDTTEFCREAGIGSAALEVWIETGWLHPIEARRGWRFSTIDLARARLILDLRGPMGVNDEGVTVVLHLVDQVHGLRRALRGVVSPGVLRNMPASQNRPAGWPPATGAMDVDQG